MSAIPDDHKLFIDAQLFYTGRVARADLVNRFAIGTATASRRLSEYVSTRNEWVLPDSTCKGYRCNWNDAVQYLREAVSTVLPEDVLPFLCDGQVRFHVPVTNHGLSCQGLLGSLNSHLVAQVTRALVSGAALDMVYQSTSSDGNTRTIFPQQLFSSGGAWYFRGFDTGHGEHRSYRFSRIVSIQAAEPMDMPADPDYAWTTSCILSLTPHPNHRQPKALRMDLQLQPGHVRNINTVQALAGYLLNDLRVDCSPEGNLNANEYPLRLLNLDELKWIQSLTIAPGFSPQK